MAYPYGEAARDEVFFEGIYIFAKLISKDIDMMHQGDVNLDFLLV